MAKKTPPKIKDNEKTHIKVENWQWETDSSRSRFTWKHGLILALIFAAALLFAFGFLIVAGVVLIAGIILNVVHFFFKKLS